MRKLLNILAVIIGLMSVTVAVTCGVLFVVTAATAFSGSPPTPDGTSATYLLVTLAGLSFLGFLIASRALLHLRQPDAGTARDMVGTAIYLLVFMGVFPLFKSSSLVLPAIVGLYFVYRFLVKRIAARAFPTFAQNADVN